MFHTRDKIESFALLRERNKMDMKRSLVRALLLEFRLSPCIYISCLCERGGYCSRLFMSLSLVGSWGLLSLGILSAQLIVLNLPAGSSCL